MTTWHQTVFKLPVLYHATLWTAYNTKGHLGVMRFTSEQECLKYCDKTGDTPLAPTNLNSKG